MSLGQEAGDILDRARERRLDALANCPDSLQGPTDYLKSEAGMQGRMTPEQRCVNDDWQECVGKVSRGPGEEDALVSESSVPSGCCDGRIDGTEVHCHTEDDNVGVFAGSSTGNNVACGMSCPMPMGPFQLSKHAMPVIIPGNSYDDEDDCWCGYCMGSILGWWNHFWWTWGCGWCMCGRPRIE